MAGKLKALATTECEGTTVEIGHRAGKVMFKVTLSTGAVFMIEEALANNVADALDDAIDLYESDPALWP